MRSRNRVLLPLLAVLAGAAIPATAGASSPSLEEPQALLRDALSCSADLATAPRPPVLLVHGTSVTAEENWSWGYQHDLRNRKHGVCTVQLPDRARVDTQRSVEYVVFAIREMSRLSGGRPVSTLGHSQGATLPVFALRVWPDLAPLVDDVVGIAGVYLNGSQEIRDNCADGCSPPFWQFATGSRLLAALTEHPLPPGPSFSALATLADEVVTPQPRANELPGGRSIQIQDVCPGRRHAEDHIFMAGDAVMHALVIDALDHPGTADPDRIDRTVCAEQVFLGIDPVKLALIAPTLLTQATSAGPDVAEEPPVRCAITGTCARPASGARVLVSSRLRDATIRRSSRCQGRCGRPLRAVLRVHAATDGHLRLRLVAVGTRRHRTVFTAARRLRAGRRSSVRVRARPCSRCSALPAGRYRVSLQTRAPHATGWRVERTVGLRITSR